MKQVVMLGTDASTMGGVSAVIGVYRDGGLLHRQGVRHIPTHCDGGAARKLRVMLAGWLAFMTCLLRRRVGIVHIHLSSRASFWRKLAFMLPARACRVPTIVHLHGSEFAVFYERECGRLARWWVRWMFDGADRVIVLSAAWNSWVSGISRNPYIRTIFNPVMVPVAVQDFNLRQAGLSICLGRLGQRKGTFDLLQALARVRAEGWPARVALGGDGDVEEVLVRAAGLGLQDAVQYIGWVRGEQKRQWLDRALCYVLPSYHEGLPMSVLEAMAMGLPVISTTVGGIPEAITHGVEGYLIEPGDIAGLAACLAALQADPALAARMGQASRDKVRRVFSAEVVLPQVEAMYAELRGPVAGISRRTH